MDGGPADASPEDCESAVGLKFTKQRTDVFSTDAAAAAASGRTLRDLRTPKVAKQPEPRKGTGLCKGRGAHQDGALN